MFTHLGSGVGIVGRGAFASGVRPRTWDETIHCDRPVKTAIFNKKKNLHELCPPLPESILVDVRFYVSKVFQ